MKKFPKNINMQKIEKQIKINKSMLNNVKKQCLINRKKNLIFIYNLRYSNCFSKKKFLIHLEELFL